MSQLTRRQKYDSSPKGKARKARYQNSEKGRAAKRRYSRSPKGLARDKRERARRREKGLCVRCGKDVALSASSCWDCLNRMEELGAFTI